MNFVIAVIIGLLMGVLSNIILDYLPYSRIYLKRKMREFKIGGGTPFQIGLRPQQKSETSARFADLAFPYCRHCENKQTWKNYLLPISCDTCGAKNTRYRILLFVYPVLFILVALFHNNAFRIVDLYILLAFYTVVFVMDVEHHVILYPVTIFGILFGAYFGLSYHTWTSTLFGGLAGGGIMLVFYLFGILYIGQIRKHSNPQLNEVALGFGDVTLSLILGFILGWPGILGGLFFGIVIGGVISGGLMLVKLLTKKYAPNDLILPYAPFLILGALIIMIL